MFRLSFEWFSCSMFESAYWEVFTKTETEFTLKKTNQCTTQTTCNKHSDRKVTSERDLWSSSLFELGHAEPKGKCVVYHAVGRLTDGALFSCCTGLQFRLVICEHQIHPGQVSTLLLFFFFWNLLQWHRQVPWACCPDQRGFRWTCQPFSPLTSFTSSDFQ